MFIPRDLTATDVDAATAGVQIDIPISVTVTEASGITISGFDAAISFDNSKLSIASTGALRQGTLITGSNLLGAPFTIFYNVVGGLIRIQMFTTDGTVNLPLNTTGTLGIIRANVASRRDGNFSH